MRKKSLALTIAYIMVSLFLHSAAHAITISGEYVYTTHIGPNGIVPAGHYFQVGASSIKPSGTGTSAEAVHVGSGPNYNLAFHPTPLSPNEYFIRVPYSGQIGQWDIIANDGTQIRTHNLDDPRILPLASNLAVSGPLLTPTLTWDAFDSAMFPSGHSLPIELGTDFFNLRVRVRLAEADSMPNIWQSPILYTTQTSYTIPSGQLMANKEYLLELQLIQSDTEIVYNPPPPPPSPSFITFTENRSQTFIPYSTFPNRPAIANAGEDQTVNEGSLVSLDGTASSDPDGDPITYSWTQISGPSVALNGALSPKPSFTAPLVGSGGEILVFRLVVADDMGEGTSDDVTVHVLNINDPPNCSLGRPSQDTIWPPNHKMVTVKIIGITDPNTEDQFTLTVTGVTQDEPVNGLGDGDTSPDAIMQGDQALIRAERAGRGNGRVYQIDFIAVDRLGEGCSGAVTVCVPHDKNNSCTDDGQSYDSMQP